jgi:hypothetical protein
LDLKWIVGWEIDSLFRDSQSNGFTQSCRIVNDSR